jgi:hypothetical protein
MKKLWKILLVMLLLGVAGGIAGYVFVYNKPHPDFLTAKAVYSLTAEELFASFLDDTEKAAALYNGKVVQLKGSLSDIEFAQDRMILVFVLEKGMFGDEGIRIAMLPGQEEAVQSLAIGADITLKGYVTGYNDTDVLLEHGSVVVE